MPVCLVHVNCARAPRGPGLNPSNVRRGLDCPGAVHSAQRGPGASPGNTAGLRAVAGSPVVRATRARPSRATLFRPLLSSLVVGGRATRAGTRTPATTLQPRAQILVAL